jgi:hypothetical protein
LPFKSEREAVLALELNNVKELLEVIQGSSAYSDAKAHFDEAIEWLTFTVNSGRDLSKSQAALKRAASGLEELCNRVDDLLPATSRQRAVLPDEVKEPLPPGTLSL